MDNKVLEYYIRRQHRLDSRGVNMDYGTASSGNWGHVGRIGMRGGSAAGGGAGFRIKATGNTVNIGGRGMEIGQYTSRAKLRTESRRFLDEAKKELRELEKKSVDERKIAKAKRLVAFAQKQHDAINQDVKTADPKKANKPGYQYIHKKANVASSVLREVRGTKNVHTSSGQMEMNESVFRSIFTRTNEGAITNHAMGSCTVDNDVIGKVMANATCAGGQNKMIITVGGKSFCGAKGNAKALKNGEIPADSFDGYLFRCNPKTGKPNRKTKISQADFMKKYGGQEAERSYVTLGDMSRETGIQEMNKRHRNLAEYAGNKAKNKHGMNGADRSLLKQSPSKSFVTEDGEIIKYVGSKMIACKAKKNDKGQFVPDASTKREVKAVDFHKKKGRIVDNAEEMQKAFKYNASAKKKKK